MIRKYALPVIAIAGAILAIYMVYLGMRRPPEPAIPFPPPKPPYKFSIAGAGIIESASEEINIGIPFNEMVHQVFVESGDFVTKDTPLFELNIQTLKAELNEAVKRRDVTMTKLEDAFTRLSLFERLKDKKAVSEDELSRQIYAVFIAKKEVDEAEAAMQVVQTNIDRSTVRAPFDGQVLQVNVRESQDATVNPFDQKPHVLFGRVNPLHVRVDIDEVDAWRMERGAPAIAYVRGNRNIHFPLQFIRIDPFIVPKESLTGDTQERVDTRVLQVIYAFDRGSLPVYTGQIVDVFIKASEE